MKAASQSARAWRLYDVTVPSRWSDGVFHTETVSAPTPSAARYRRFLDASDAWPDLTFGRFVGMVKVRVASAAPSADAYDHIRRFYGLDVKHGDRVEIRREGAGYDGKQGHVVHPSGHAHYVHVVLDGTTHRDLFHPDSVRILPASHTPVSSDTPNAEGERKVLSGQNVSLSISEGQSANAEATKGEPPSNQNDTAPSEIEGGRP
ncbi:hypothetical protein [Methylorubrum extorquens]|uniref:hypothetical protein n=1 Tax=Methylorubrum extorquens TaxID=408 RepID=UPI002237830D|nr:hypothetical protein [Methylorubrum extorquens]UYW33670.1 hypothetical protein OKB92_06190 [Methylorubrum extorquens]